MWSWISSRRGLQYPANQAHQSTSGWKSKNKSGHRCSRQRFTQQDIPPDVWEDTNETITHTWTIHSADIVQWPPPTPPIVSLTLGTHCKGQRSYEQQKFFVTNVPGPAIVGLPTCECLGLVQLNIDALQSKGAANMPVSPSSVRLPTSSPGTRIGWISDLKIGSLGLFWWDWSFPQRRNAKPSDQCRTIHWSTMMLPDAPEG